MFEIERGYLSPVSYKIENPDSNILLHLRNKNIKIASMREALKAKFLNPAAAENFLDRIHTEKKRYARDQFRLIEKTISQYRSEAVDAALQYCLTNELNSAVDFRDAIIHFS